MAQSWSRSSGRPFPRQSGQATTEYVLLLALIIVPLVAAFRQFGVVLRTLLGALNSLVFGPGA